MRRLASMLSVVLILVSVGLTVYIFGIKEERPPPVIDYMGVSECEGINKNLYSGPFTNHPCDDLRRFFERMARERGAGRPAPLSTAPTPTLR